MLERNGVELLRGQRGGKERGQGTGTKGQCMTGAIASPCGKKGHVLETEGQRGHDEGVNKGETSPGTMKGV